MKRTMLLLLLLAGVVHAQVDPAPQIKWTVAISEGAGVPADGRHIGLLWSRDQKAAGAVVVFRRVAPPGDASTALHRIHVVDQLAQIVPMFMYPDTFKTQYYPAFDAGHHPIPPGTQLGVWTVAGEVDGDPKLWVDEVEPGHRYLYALVPAVPGSAPWTYQTLDGDAVVTPPIAPRPASLWHRRWFQGVLGLAGIGVIAGLLAAVKRRRRAGASAAGKASSTP